MYDVAKGRLLSYRGWTYANGRESKREMTYYGFVNPDGVRVTITNLRAFCREFGLNRGYMFQLINDERENYKGWTWRDDDE